MDCSRMHTTTLYGLQSQAYNHIVWTAVTCYSIQPHCMDCSHML